MYSIGDKSNDSYDLFEGIVDSIINDHMDIKKTGNIYIQRIIKFTDPINSILYKFN